MREAREKFFAKKIGAAELRAVEDECIREVVKRQEEVGLKGITDGEFRRTYFHVDFLEKLDGVETHYGEFVAKFRKDDGSEVGFKPPTMHVESKIKHATPIQGADFDFLKSDNNAHAKGVHTGAFDAAFPRRTRSDLEPGLPKSRRFL